MKTTAPRGWAPLLAAALIVGCASEDTPITVKHSLLVPSRSRGEGVVLVRPFEDARSDDQRPYLGNRRTRDSFDTGKLTLRDGQKLPVLLSRYFADALGKAGYTAVFDSDPAAAGTPPDGVLEGVIREFWAHALVFTWHDVKVDLRLVRAPGEKPIWETQVSGSESHYLWVGSNGEYERVIREALDKALIGAVEAFSSNEFSAALHADRADATR